MCTYIPHICTYDICFAKESQSQFRRLDDCINIIDRQFTMLYHAYTGDNNNLHVRLDIAVTFLGYRQYIDVDY